MSSTIRRYSCACGRVQCEAVNEPILHGVCYCLDCQEGGRRIEALPGAQVVCDLDGGTPYLTYRDDRFRCVAGAELLESHRLRPQSRTRRVVASCCNTGLFLKFDPGFWVSTYRLRYSGETPPVDMRTNMRRRTSNIPLPDNAPAYASFPPSLFARLAMARIAMAFGN